MKLRNIFLPLLVALATGLTMTGCDDDENVNDGDILKPISQHLVGKWRGEASYKQNEKGEWIEDKKEPYNAMITFRADGTARFIAISSDGWERLSLTDWEGDDANNALIAHGGPSTLSRLTADHFDIVADQAGNEAGEVLQGKFKWTHVRTSESDMTFSEQLLGKWEYVGSYEKVDGKWVESDFASVDEGYYILREGGDGTVHVRYSDIDDTSEMTWSANGKTSELNITYTPEESISEKVTLSEDGRGLSLYYSWCKDVDTGEVREGEFKDVFVHVQE